MVKYRYPANFSMRQRCCTIITVKMRITDRHPICLHNQPSIQVTISYSFDLCLVLCETEFNLYQQFMESFDWIEVKLCEKDVQTV